jgi:hypothetical protein
VGCHRKRAGQVWSAAKAVRVKRRRIGRLALAQLDRS